MTSRIADSACLYISGTAQGYRLNPQTATTVAAADRQVQTATRLRRSASQGIRLAMPFGQEPNSGTIWLYHNATPRPVRMRSQIRLDRCG